MKKLDKHARDFARALHWDLRGLKPICDSLWVNIMPEGGSHTSHIHTNAVISGTYYVTVPEGAGPIVYEDPRLPLMMAAPPRKPRAWLFAITSAKRPPPARCCSGKAGSAMRCRSTAPPETASA